MVRGFDDVFYAPHSRHTEVRKADIEKVDKLTILAESDEAGVFLIMNDDGRQIFVMGHPEYDRYTLHNEYIRDKKKGLPIDLPVNYYPDDDDTQRPLLQWRSHGNILYSNWLNYYLKTTSFSQLSARNSALSAQSQSLFCLRSSLSAALKSPTDARINLHRLSFSA